MEYNLINKKVKLFLKNGMTAEGVVSDCSENQYILKSFNSENILVINSPKENVIMIHIFLEEHQQKIEQKLPISPEPNELKLDHFEPGPTLRAKKLADLKQLQIQQHKEDIKKHLTSWKPSTSLKYTNYEQPNLSQLSPFNSPTKKSNRSPITNTSELPDLQRKKSKT